ncbi:zinc-dependent metalloprotease [Tahibacter amnicola]|uniref:Zinc-dependent metalloprotease n=1 Tax=Tahibacter amnicola TaxID=2976241 RepID=A0ABY6BAG7_9GAMM|nr:zinc-dependent metalloprotease [Tahibacter amnicola]UXI67054.1 zinc-dependent metalloprotease [Tahibacter amnicola]
MKRSFLWGVAGLGVFAAGSATAADYPLFSPAPLAYRAASSDPAYASLARHAASQAMDVVTARAEAVDASAQSLPINLNLAGKVGLTALQTKAYKTDDGALVWQGIIPDPTQRRPFNAREIPDDPLNSVMLVRNGDKLTGNIRVQGQLYKVRPLFDGRHVIVEVDESRSPPDHPAEDYKQLLAEAAPPPESDTTSRATQDITTIRVMVNYTTGVSNRVADVPGLINLAIAEANQGYINSDVQIRLQLAARSRVSYRESGSFGTDLNRYRDTDDDYMDSIHGLRNEYDADVGVLLINNDESCGKAAAIGATARTAFAVAHWDCATGYYSFAHEIGHLQSARHDPGTDSSNTPYSYGHGYRDPAGNWRTIMAYDCDDHCRRLNFWSNPNRTYNGKPMGTATRSDNHRVLNNTRNTVAGFR